MIERFSNNKLHTRVTLYHRKNAVVIATEEIMYLDYDWEFTGCVKIPTTLWKQLVNVGNDECDVECFFQYQHLPDKIRQEFFNHDVNDIDIRLNEMETFTAYESLKIVWGFDSHPPTTSSNELMETSEVSRKRKGENSNGEDDLNCYTSTKSVKSSPTSKPSFTQRRESLNLPKLSIPEKPFYSTDVLLSPEILPSNYNPFTEAFRRANMEE